MSPRVRGEIRTLSKSRLPGIAARVGSLLGLSATVATGAGAPDPGFSYRHEVVPEQPWSIHVLKVDRRRSDLVLRTTLGGGQTLGLRPLSEQVKALPAGAGSPLAALNGDFYSTSYHHHSRDGSHSFPGDPRGLQILEGELVSAATDQASFWIARDGTPQATNVVSQLAATWPDGTVLPLGLNELRRGHAAVLYTARMAATNRSRSGLELVLEQAGPGPWLPLRPGEEYMARIRAIRPPGPSSMARDELVLALPEESAEGVPRPQAAPGQVLRISTASAPDLRGVPLAISGGEVLLRDGRKVALKPLASMAYKYRSAVERHPRSAIGASRDWWFLVQVDGRQPLLSKGMTLDELADYLLQLGCELAMSLDGGPSSTFWLEGQVRNSPCNRRELAVANGIVVLQKPSSPPTTPGSPPQEVAREEGR